MMNLTAMKRITYGAIRTASCAVTHSPCTPIEFLTRIRASRRTSHGAPMNHATLVASAARLVLRSR